MSLLLPAVRRAPAAPMRFPAVRLLLCAGLLVSAAPRSLAAQDAPDGERLRTPARTVWAARGRAAITATARTLRAEVPGAQFDLQVGPTQTVTGVQPHAVIPVGFADRPVTAATPDIAQRFYGAGTDTAYTVPQYFREVSGGRFTVQGAVQAPIVLPEAAAAYVGRRTGFGGTADRLDAFVLAALEAADQAIDFSALADPDDNRVPAVVLLTAGAEAWCTPTQIWPHRYTVSQLRTDVAGTTTGTPFVTNDRLNGKPVLLDDYIVQGLDACGAGGGLAPAGTLIHESGHLIGLPDLYSANSVGPVQHWDLMATGNYNTQATPAWLSAWSRLFLGWSQATRIDSVAAGDSLRLTLPAVGRTDAIAAIRFHGSSEYVLLETRTRLGSDRALPGEGLLVWYINPAAIAAGLPQNSVNANREAPGVFLLSADEGCVSGMWTAGTTNRGDAGDPFPGTTNRQAFAFADRPSFCSPATKQGPGFTLTGITVQPTGAGAATQLVVAADIVTATTRIVLDAPGTLVGGQRARLQVRLVTPEQDLPAAVTWAIDPTTLTALGLSITSDTGRVLVLAGTLRRDAVSQRLPVRATLRLAESAVVIGADPLLTIHPPLAANGRALLAHLLDPASTPLAASDRDLLDANADGRLGLAEFVRAHRAGWFTLTRDDLLAHPALRAALAPAASAPRP